MFLFLFTGMNEVSAQCYVNFPSLSNNAGCAELSSVPSSYYGEVEFMWAKNEGGSIIPLTSFSTSSSLTYCPAESGYYRVCARRVGCSTIYESYDVYIGSCSSPDLDQYISVDGGSWVLMNSVEVCEGQDVILNFESYGYSNWTFAYQLPDGSLVTNTGNTHSDQLSLADISPDEAGTYTVTYTNPDGCSNTESFEVEVNALPVVTSSFTHASCKQDDGTITFSFQDQSGRTNIEFSIDGGTTYPYNVADNIGSTTITGLGADTYDLFVRWGNDECPLDLADVTINNSTGCATIGDFVFDDTNFNGILDDGETGVEGITVQLFELGNDDPIDMDVTDDKGAYIFLNVEPNITYFLKFSNLPDNYQFTAQSEGEDDEKDSDVDPSTGNTFSITPSIGDNLTGIDAGVLNTLNFPVEWLGFDVKQVGTHAVLNWATATELNAASFEIERSVDGLLFEPIASVEAAGTSMHTQQYEFMDKAVRQLGTDKISYRLRQLDYDGSFEYSKVVELKLGENLSMDLTVYPNPSQDQISVSWIPLEGMQNLQVRNMLGQIVYRLEISDQDQPSETLISLTDWSPGAYFVQLTSEQSIETLKLLVK
ncbi:MAG: SdrD B-like domain-containing protein [Bacteroidia bacterium]|nr:SdrD B-like domain-containing protein [Bacteroidia bacterium]